MAFERNLFLTLTITVIMLFVATASRASITILVKSDPAGVTLAGTGTHAASSSIATVQRNGGIVPVGVTRSTTASNWSLSVPFDIQVTGSSGSSYTLQAKISTADAVRLWKLNSVALNSVSAVTILPNGTYGPTVMYTLMLTIPNNAAPGAFSNTVDLFVVSN